MTKGVIYAATGEKYIAEALVSAASLKAQSPGLPVCFFADRTVSSPWVDQVIPLEPGPFHPVLKPRSMAASPYERTLYLDTDTYICGDISRVFDVLDRFDLAAVHARHALQGSALRHLPDVVLQVPEAFVQFNGGVIMFRRSPATLRFLQRWIELIESYQRLAAERGSDYRRDQTALREAIYESDLRVATLPRAYNCRYHFVGHLSGEVKILHGRMGDFATVAGQLNGSSRPRVFMNYDRGLHVVTDKDVHAKHRRSTRQPSLFRRAAVSYRNGGVIALAAAARRRLIGAPMQQSRQGALAPAKSGGEGTTSKAAARIGFREASSFPSTDDIYIISYPKTGRTWLRVLLGHTLQLHFQRPDLDYWQPRFGGDSPQLPRIQFSHDDGKVTRTAAEINADKRRYAAGKVILLVRDPRDTLVSAYFQASIRKGGKDPSRRFQGTIHEYLHQPLGSVDAFMRFYNLWAEQRRIPRDFMLLRYEDMHADLAKELRRVLGFVGVTGVSDAIIAEAVTFASFENMHRLEADESVSSGKLQARNLSNPESFKTRRGIVGGYADYLSAEDIEYLNKRIRVEFPAFYGYAI